MKLSERTITEFVATALVVVSTFLGTTNYYGAIIQFIPVGIAWWWLIYRFKTYGFIPAQIAFTLVAAWNFYYAVLR